MRVIANDKKAFKPIHLVIETQEEADALRAVTHFIGGSPNYSPRGHFEKLAKLLASNGATLDDKDLVQPGSRIYFINYGEGA